MLLRAGEPLESARGAVVMLHGRGASPQDILLTAGPLAAPGFAFLAPQAPPGEFWYPQPFTAPLEANEPWLSDALAAVDEVVREAELHLPVPAIVLLGFSQGACLALEYSARHARRYGGVVGWSGGLIGPDDAPRGYPGSLEGTPVLLGCSEEDPYIPAVRVTQAAEVLRRLGGEVDQQMYPGLGHAVNADELRRVRELMSAVLAGKEEVA
jgi:predicted esterase